jgi:hypothetical protein
MEYFGRDTDEESRRATWSNPIAINSQQLWEENAFPIPASGMSPATVFSSDLSW